MLIISYSSFKLLPVHSWKVFTSKKYASNQQGNLLSIILPLHDRHYVYWSELASSSYQTTKWASNENLLQTVSAHCSRRQAIKLHSLQTVTELKKMAKLLLKVKVRDLITFKHQVVKTYCVVYVYFHVKYLTKQLLVMNGKCTQDIHKRQTRTLSVAYFICNKSV